MPSLNMRHAHKITVVVSVVLGVMLFASHQQAAASASVEASKYRAGLVVAQKKGLSGKEAQCQARIFTKHAEPDAARGPDPWTAGGPKYFGELRRICGVVSPATIPGVARSTVGLKTSAGYNAATKNGYSGEKANCYARVFARHAYLGPNGRTWLAPVSPTYTAELFNECGVSR